MSQPAVKDASQFWEMRAKKYDRLEWASKGDFLHLFLNLGNFHESDTVLDVGTGTGIIAHSIAPFVKKVVGIDISEAMVENAKKPTITNIEYRLVDAHEMPFLDGSFDKITARMVFHHITEKTQEAMNECFRVLKPGGKMVFSEGVPPTRHVVPFYTEMFKWKEDRITFMDEDLERLMKTAGFQSLHQTVYIARQASIKNWLVNSGIPQENQDRIFQMHLDLDERGKNDYNMTLKENDCLIDMKFIILTGIKH